MDLLSYNILFAEKNMTWERSHSFAPAAYCFDSFSFSESGIAVVTYWALLSRPFYKKNEILLKDDSLTSKIRENSFYLSEPWKKRIKELTLNTKLPQGISRFYSDSDRPEANYFLSITRSGQGGIIHRSEGVTDLIRPFLTCIQDIISEYTSQPGGESLWPDPQMMKALQAHWNFDVYMPSLTESGEKVIPAEINETRPPTLI